MKGIQTLAMAGAFLAAGFAQTPTFADDVYDFDEGYLQIDINAPVDQSNESVTFSKTLPLERYGATLTVSVSCNEPDNYCSAEFVTSGEASFDQDGLGQRGPLWPYSSVWNVRRKAQVIYAAGVGVDAMLADLEARFNGAGGGVAFSATGDGYSSYMTITMRNR